MRQNGATSLLMLTIAGFLVSDGRGTAPVFTATKQIKENILLQILCSFRNMSLLCTNFEIDNESTRNKEVSIIYIRMFSTRNQQPSSFSPKTIF